ncbi:MULTISPECIES: hypothetical protein [Nocardiopsis]|uniref:Uncharacterized protein n=1 Tax=Nocardiopsis metallicus TaxID=179819 RepID=A0A840WAK4_9ACTN|nr:hypothetical protein [Nocardiopsis metallicus]
MPAGAIQASPPEAGLPIPEHVLCPLLYKQWNLTIEGVAPHEIYVARRPFDWTGDGDRWERITAPTRRGLLRLLGHRLQGTDPTDASSARDACVLLRIL